MATKPNSKTTRTATDIAAEKLTEARALVDQRRTEHEQAEETHAELITRLTRGDASVSALDLVTAEAEITRLGYLVEAARKAVTPAEKALDSAQAIDSPTLARFVAERIEADPFAFGVYGFPVTVNADDRTKPGVYVNQATATKTDPGTGIISGHVGITVVTPNGSPIDGAAVLAGLAAIERAGAALVNANASPSPDGVTVDVRLTDVKPDMPTLTADIDSNALRNFALDLIENITKQGGWSSRGDSDPYGGGLYGGSGLWDRGTSVRRILSGLDTVTVTSQGRDGDQEQRTVRVVFDLSSRQFGARDLSEFTRTSIGNLVGEMAAGIGRIEAARVVSGEPTIEKPTPGREFSDSAKSGVRLVVEVDAVARIAG
ncbi:flagellar FliJ family protein [Plantactinospora endophytica]|uniref:Uncharacterized protein n=1 Tax=Plantactinospora endophytica TaxID=673535 RepID=A0ABQ4ECB4_9ACTN|nr:flagellar FliJ family protein [Plantactinospora endophytica]GIG92380.1 hypothetical protein Pen02_73160 [Plantactinospora endophytica]